MALAATTFHQPGFSQAVVFSGLSNPTAVRFLPDGRVIVIEKSGLIKLFPNITTNTFTQVADLRTEVHNFWDRGLLGLAVDPNFATNNFIYLAYTFDAPIGGAAPTWGPGDGTSDPCPTPPGATTDGCVVSGRLVRLTATGADWTASEHVILNDWCQQFPSHSIGSLTFGADGYLYMSGGDGASFGNADWGQFGGTLGGPPPVTPKNPCGDPPAGVGGDMTPPTAEGGALRAQSAGRAPGEPRLLNGSILRIDASTGAGVPGNPFFGSSDPNAQRIIAYGVRNPFRIAHRPGTNDLWISDVGYNIWEEIDHLPDPTAGLNFGWPCWEGNGHESSYGGAGLNICTDLYAAGTATLPFLTYNHAFHVPRTTGAQPEARRSRGWPSTKAAAITPRTTRERFFSRTTPANACGSSFPTRAEIRIPRRSRRSRPRPRVLSTCSSARTATSTTSTTIRATSCASSTACTPSPRPT